MKKSNVYGEARPIKCSVCGKDLMEDMGMSMVNIIQNIETDKIVSVRPCCKRQCDHIISKDAKNGEISGWKDLSDFTNPYLYLKHILSVMNNMYSGKGFENQEAFESYKNLIIDMYPYVTRNMDEEEKRAVQIDSIIPF